MLEIQKYLQNNTLEQLEAELGIKHNRHNKYNNLVLLKYDQIKSPTYHPIVKECRGIILDESDYWKVISYPFNRFYNYGQNNSEYAIDWSSAVVQTKEDGSLTQLFSYRSEWLVATSGKADGGGEVNGFDFTFEQLFWRIFNQLDYKLPSDTEYTYIFELCTIYNKVVVEYKYPQLTLIGARNKFNFKELKHKELELLSSFYNWSTVKNFNLTNIEDILEYISLTKGFEREGLIVVDKDFNRIKIKSEEYVALHHIKSNVNTPHALLEVIRKGEVEELLTYFKEFTTEINNLNTKYQALTKLIKRRWSNRIYITDKKEFALTVKDYFYSDCLFSLYNNKINSVEDYLLNLDIRKLYQWIQLLD